MIELDTITDFLWNHRWYQDDKWHADNIFRYHGSYVKTPHSKTGVVLHELRMVRYLIVYPGGKLEMYNRYFDGHLGDPDFFEKLLEALNGSYVTF